MINRYTISLGLLCCVIILHSQDKIAKRYAKSITTTDLKQYLSVLSHDSLEGRYTGTRGQKKAMQYISTHFKNIGLTGPVKSNTQNPYLQSFKLYAYKWQSIYFKKDKEQKENLDGFIYYSNSETQGEDIVSLIFVNKINEKTKTMDIKDKFVVLVGNNTEELKQLSAGLSYKKPAGFIFVTNDQEKLNFIFTRFKNYFDKEHMILTKEVDSEPKVIVCNPTTIEWLFGDKMEKLQEGTTTTAIFNADKHIRELMSENILGFIEGTEKPNEVLILTSHYDHIGIEENGDINNGADDDGSGTSVIMELAQAFAQANEKGNKPKRSILFMCVAGEEVGLFGSKYYTDIDPVFPLANTVTNLNIDMVGRIDPEHENKKDYIYLIGSDKLSQELHTLSENINKQTLKLDFDYKYNDENDPNRFYYRSDHYNFAKNNIPIIFYFNGTHADYHKPTDTIEKINFEMMKKRAELIFYTAWELANRSNRVKVDEDKITK